MSPVAIQTLLLSLTALCVVGLAVVAVMGLVRAAAEPPPEIEASTSVAPVTKPAPPPPRDLYEGLRKTRNALIGRLERLLRPQAKLDEELWEEVEGVLFGADLGVRTAEDLMQTARGEGSPEAVRDALERRALAILASVPRPDLSRTSTPHVVLVVGVNGSGKTTSIAKLAARYTREGRSVILAAADTFRAAAIDQLGVWAERVGVEIVKGTPGGDPAAVAFDAIVAARARKLDVVIIDTAGRLHTQAGLMDELVKISRVVKKEIPDAPHEVVLVLDANTGQNAIRQAQEFSRAVEVDHILLSKLDGTAKGGVVLGIAQEVGLPVRYLGVGESAQDLRDFEPESFVEALFAWDAEEMALPGA